MAKYKCINCGAIFNDMKCPKCDTPKSVCNKLNSKKEVKKEYIPSKNPNMVICPDCKKEVSKNAKTCVNCGRKMIVLGKDGDKANSPMSIVAAILSMITITCFVGIILGIIDLCINAPEYKHSCSIFAVVFGVLAGIALLLICL